jgi:hypothetical protein
MEILEVVEDRNVEIGYLPGNVRNRCVDISHRVGAKYRN